jgi:HK97 family phage major capsid protein
MITRDDAAALIPEDASAEIFKSVAENSAVLSLARRLPNMTRGQRRLPVMSALPLAYFVDGEPGEDNQDDENEDGFKTKTGAEWENKYIYAEEVAAIIPIAIAVLEDADYDIWGELRPYIAQAFGTVIDAAILHGTNAPAAWPDDIVTDAVSAGNSLAVGDVGDLYDDIMGEDGLISLVEEDGYFPNGYIGAISMRGSLRGLRVDTTGMPLFRPAIDGMTGASSYSLDGEPIMFPRNGGLDPTEALLICGDWSKLVYSIRTDITYKVLDQAVIQDPDTGSIIYNLAQQDMVALRMYMRLGWQVPNPINLVQSTAADRYPFSVLTPATSG